MPPTLAPRCHARRRRDRRLLQLEIRLGHLFWRDLERHHPGIDSLTLAPDVTAAWRERARSLPDGRPRRNLDSLFFPVRSFYLDIAQWAAENGYMGRLGSTLTGKRRRCAPALEARASPTCSHARAHPFDSAGAAGADAGDA